jgi:hypothetical protein
MEKMPDPPLENDRTDRTERRARAFLHSAWAFPLSLLFYFFCAAYTFLSHNNIVLLFVLSFACISSAASVIEFHSPPHMAQRPPISPTDEGPGLGGTSAFEVIGSITIIAVLLLIVFSFITSMYGRPHRRYGQLTACKSNLKNLGTALEMYSADHAGSYPHSLGQLTPNYLKTLPTCSSAGKMSYAYIFGINPDNYTVFCAGTNHGNSGCKPDFPKYDCTTGLIEN